MHDELRDNPGVIAPPPLIYAIPLLFGLILHVLFPVHLIRLQEQCLNRLISKCGFDLLTEMWHDLFGHKFLLSLARAL